jgi:PIN domain nuclease of toxin-antitoxin system
MLHAVADTHAIIWYLYDDPRLSAAAREAFEETRLAGGWIGFSTITLAEIIYLIEKRRIHREVFGRMLEALDRPMVVLGELPFDRAVATTMIDVDREQVPDLPDRIIAATARHYEVPLISRDRRIVLSDLDTIW